MQADRVRMWRAPHEDGVLVMEGWADRYAVEPRGDYVFGIVAAGAMRARREHASHIVQPGQLVAWDATAPHEGEAVDGSWHSRLIVVEVGGLASFTRDGDHDDPLADVHFPEPVFSDAALVGGFLRLHAALSAPASSLEHDEYLAGWLRSIAAHSPASRTARPSYTARDDRALRAAMDYLGDRVTQNVRLDELAAAAGIGKFRLIRLFRGRTGLPPHAFQTAHRIRIARRLLEAGHGITAVAAATGFSDQSHFHRHFRRNLGITPGEYRRRLGRTEREQRSRERTPRSLDPG